MGAVFLCAGFLCQGRTYRLNFEEVRKYVMRKPWQSTKYVVVKHEHECERFLNVQSSSRESCSITLNDVHRLPNISLRFQTRYGLFEVPCRGWQIAHHFRTFKHIDVWRAKNRLAAMTAIALDLILNPFMVCVYGTHYNEPSTLNKMQKDVIMFFSSKNTVYFPFFIGSQDTDTGCIGLRYACSLG